MSSPLDHLKTQLQRAMVAAYGETLSGADPLLVNASNPKFGDYQSNAPLSLAKPLNQPPRTIASTIVDHLEVGEAWEPPTIAGPGFINFTLKTSYLEKQLELRLADPRLGIPAVKLPLRVVVDFSSPNIAKEMHVGHLRSTIIGDCLARILEFLGHEVLRLNHVGDWGTQFGMLITYLREVCPEALTAPDAVDLGDLVAFYRQAKQRFDSDPDFQTTARQEVVRLQSGEPDSLHAWQLLCAQSRREFEKIYNLLDIKLTERGESFYNPLLPQVIQALDQTGLLVEDQGAKCVFLEGYTNKAGDPQPLIVQKSDGGYIYATTDLAALRYRIEQDRADWIIYVTDAGQSTHFAQVFQVAERAGWIPGRIRLVHVPFGLVQGEDGKKLKTRSGDTVRLQDLLDEAIERTRNDLVSRLEAEGRQETPEFIDHVAQTVGIGAVKYADLSQNRTSNYVFSYDKMLSLKGNTAPYLLYAYVRVRGIGRNLDLSNPYLDLSSDTTLSASEFDADEYLQKLIEESKRSFIDFHLFDLGTELEVNLARQLLKLEAVIDSVSDDLLPNHLCEYLFELSQKFNQFYDRCPILQAEEPLRNSRLGLAQLTARTLKLGLSLLGIQVLERM